MKNKNSIIDIVEHPDSELLYQARHDEAVVTGQDYIEKPYWYENIETGQLYHDLYACIGWPSEVTEKNDGMPGYAAIIGIVRPSKSLEHYNPVYAKFQLLAENQSTDVQTLLSMCEEIRGKYGFGIRKDFLNVWHGDPERFITTISLKNEQLIRQYGENNTINITPPVDFYQATAFDIYIRSLKSVLLPGNLRFFFGGCNLLKNNLKEFRKNNPSVCAIGGLVHTLLLNCTWMEETNTGIFNIEENYG